MVRHFSVHSIWSSDICSLFTQAMARSRSPNLSNLSRTRKKINNHDGGATFFFTTKRIMSINFMNEVFAFRFFFARYANVNCPTRFYLKPRRPFLRAKKSETGANIFCVPTSDLIRIWNGKSVSCESFLFALTNSFNSLCQASKFKNFARPLMKSTKVCLW